jgi:hypothetical protein
LILKEYGISGRTRRVDGASKVPVVVKAKTGKWCVSNEFACRGNTPDDPGKWGKAQVFNLPFRDEALEANDAVCLEVFDHGAS